MLIQTAAGAGRFPHKVEDSLKVFVEQSSRFIARVCVGDTLCSSLTVADLTPLRTTGLLIMRTEVLNERGEMVKDGGQTYLLRRRAAETEG